MEIIKKPILILAIVMLPGSNPPTLHEIILTLEMAINRAYYPTIQQRKRQVSYQQSSIFANQARTKSEFTSEILVPANSESQLTFAKVNLMQLMGLPVVGDFQIEATHAGESINRNSETVIKMVYEKTLTIKPPIKNAAENNSIVKLRLNIICLCLNIISKLHLKV